MKIKFNKRKLDKELKKKLERGLTKAANYVEGEVKDSIAIGQDIEWRTSKKGNRYPVGKDPSKPGEPPHTLTGRLKQSIDYAVKKGHRNITARVGTNVKYARRLELGFVGRDSKGRNINQAPRPYMRPALERSTRKILEFIVKG